MQNLQRPPNPPQPGHQQQFAMQQSPMNHERPQAAGQIAAQFGDIPAEQLAIVRARYQDHLNKKNAQAQQVVPQQRPVSNMPRPPSAQQIPPVAQPQMQKPMTQNPAQQVPAQPIGAPPITQPPQQAKSLLVGQQILPINPNLVLSPEQVAIMETKEVPRQILGQLSNQIPMQFKTWAQVKGYLTQNNAPPQYHDALRTRQAQHFQLLARAQMMRRQGAAGTPQQQQQLQQQQHQQLKQQQLPQPPVSQSPQPSQTAAAPPVAAQKLSVASHPLNQQPIPNISTLNQAQLQHLQSLAQQGKLTPQQSHQLQQQIFTLRQNHERQRAAAAQRALQQQNSAQVPAPQAPKPPVVARPQQPSSDSPSASKKMKRERDPSEEVVLLDQRPALQQSNQQPPIARPIVQHLPHPPPQSQFANHGPPGPKSNVPSQTPSMQQSPMIKQQPGVPGQQVEATQSMHQAQEGEHGNQALQQKQMITMLVKMLEEERSSHENRPPLQLQPKEKDHLYHQLSDANTKNMIRRTDQLLPMFVLLGGTPKATRELIRTVFLQ